MKTRKRLARRITEMDSIVINDVAHRVLAVETVGYGSDPERTTIYAGNLPPMHFWWDDKVNVPAES